VAAIASWRSGTLRTTLARPTNRFAISKGTTLTRIDRPGAIHNSHLKRVALLGSYPDYFSREAVRALNVQINP